MRRTFQRGTAGLAEQQLHRMGAGLVCGLSALCTLAGAQAQHPQAEPDPAPLASPELQPTEPATTGAQATEPATTDARASAPRDVCTEPIRLDGASAEPDASNVSFEPSWRPLLEQAAACLQRPEYARACLRVQGHYDDRIFSPGIRTALGSERAAQLHRARGRAESVMSELYALNVPASQILAVPAPTGPTYRGASITLDPGCAPVSAEATPAPQLPGWAQSPERMAAELERAGLLAPAPQAEHAPELEPALSAWSIEGELAGGFMARDPSDLWYAALRPGVGVHRDGWFGRAFLGVATGDNPEHRVGFEWGIAGGVAPLDWLELGAIGSHRLSSQRAFRAVLEQTWSLGAMASERVWRSGDTTLWVSQSLWPLSFVRRRAELRAGELVNIRDRTDYAPRIELAISVRAHVL